MIFASFDDKKICLNFTKTKKNGASCIIQI